MVGNVLRPFLTMRRNAPNANYAGWENSTFLILNMAYEMTVQHMPLYESSPVDIWCETTFISMLPEWVQSLLIQGRIPFASGLTAGTLQQGNNGLLRRVFIPTITELGVLSATNTFQIGSDFGIFDDNDSRTLRNSAGIGVLQHTRTVNTTGNHIVGVSAIGNIGPSHALTANMAIRPIIALPNTARVTAEGFLTGGAD